MAAVDGIREPIVRELARSGVPLRARVIGRKGGYAINVVCGEREQTLCTTRTGVRLFSLEAATKFLCGFGITQFEVDASRLEPGRIRKPRPDRAEALRKTRTRPRQATLV